MLSDLVNLVDYIASKDGVYDKPQLVKAVQEQFGLVKDRSVYYSDKFAIRFSSSASTNFANTVISLSNLQKYDDKPFLVCLVTPNKNILYLANTTFIHKVSHSSQQLRLDNIKGSINGSDIVKEFNGLRNAPENFEKLYNIHAELGFNDNLPRLVEATNNIIASGVKFTPTSEQVKLIEAAPDRALSFIGTDDYWQLKAELDAKVKMYSKEIMIAAFIENVNVRGRIIEYIIAGEDENLRSELVSALQSSAKIPSFRTKNSLADYIKDFPEYVTATDIKTKIMLLHSNPKAYNIDKMLEFLSHDKSVFMFYFVGIEPNKIISQVLISMFQTDLLVSTILLKHWAGRNSRGVTQLEGGALNKLIISPNNDIDKEESVKFLQSLLVL